MSGDFRRRTRAWAIDRLLVFDLYSDADEPILGYSTDWLRSVVTNSGLPLARMAPST